jgi:hypothetical protein
LLAEIALGNVRGVTMPSLSCSCEGWVG